MQYVLVAGLLYGLWSFAGDALVIIGLMAGACVVMLVLAAMLGAKPKGRR